MMGSGGAKYKTVEMPSGVHDMFSLMEFLTNPKKYKKHLEDLKKFTDEANKSVENIGKANEIEKLLASAKAKDEKADSAVQKAEAESSVIIEAASVSIDVDKKATRAALQAAQADKSKYELLAKAKATELQDRENGIFKAENDIDKRTKALEKREAQVLKDLSLIEDKKKLLASL